MSNLVYNALKAVGHDNVGELIKGAQAAKELFAVTKHHNHVLV